MTTRSATTRRRDQFSAPAIIALTLGAVLRAVQYAANSSLWYDEIALARNVVDRSPGHLLAVPLDHMQMAPSGFLAALEVASIGGATEYALRLPAFVASLAALWLFYRVARRFLADWPFAGACLLFALSPSLIFLGSNVKPYSGDVAIALLIVFLGIRYIEHPQGRALPLALGGLSMLFSYPAVLICAVLGGLLAIRRATPRTDLLRIGGFWAATAAAATWLALSLRTPDAAAFMDAYWAQQAAGQLPEKIGNAVAYFFGNPNAGLLPGLLALVGLVVSRTRGWPAAVLLVPLLAAIVGSIAGILPLWDRLAVYAVWPVPIYAMIAAEDIARRRPIAGYAAVVACCVPLALLTVQNAPPYYYQDSRPVFEQLRVELKPGDAVYVECRAVHAAEFYGSDLDYVSGQCHETAAGYSEEILRIAAQRIWIVQSQILDPGAIDSAKAELGPSVAHVPDPHGNLGAAASYATAYTPRRRR